MGLLEFTYVESDFNDFLKDLRRNRQHLTKSYYVTDFELTVVFNG